jgi:hypothetical protein
LFLRYSLGHSFLTKSGSRYFLAEPDASFRAQLEAARLWEPSNPLHPLLAGKTIAAMALRQTGHSPPQQHHNKVQMGPETGAEKGRQHQDQTQPVCGVCNQPLLQYGPGHPRYAALGELDEWECDLRGATGCSHGPGQRMHGCQTFDTCDWCACEACVRCCSTTSPVATPSAPPSATPAHPTSEAAPAPPISAPAEERGAPVDVQGGVAEVERQQPPPASELSRGTGGADSAPCEITVTDGYAQQRVGPTAAQEAAASAAATAEAAAPPSGGLLQEFRQLSGAHLPESRAWDADQAAHAAMSGRGVSHPRTGEAAEPIQMRRLVANRPRTLYRPGVEGLLEQCREFHAQNRVRASVFSCVMTSSTVTHSVVSGGDGLQPAECLVLAERILGMEKSAQQDGSQAWQLAEACKRWATLRQQEQQQQHIWQQQLGESGRQPSSSVSGLAGHEHLRERWAAARHLESTTVTWDQEPWPISRTSPVHRSQPSGDNGHRGARAAAWRPAAAAAAAAALTTTTRRRSPLPPPHSSSHRGRPGTATARPAGGAGGAKQRAAPAQRRSAPAATAQGMSMSAMVHAARGAAALHIQAAWRGVREVDRERGGGGGANVGFATRLQSRSGHRMMRHVTPHTTAYAWPD